MAEVAAAGQEVSHPLLEVRPERDPVLRPGHTVVMPRRPRTVTVVTEDGDRCAVRHAPGLRRRRQCHCRPDIGVHDKKRFAVEERQCIADATRRFQWLRALVKPPDSHSKAFSVPDRQM